MCSNPEVEVFDGSRVPGPAPAKCVNCGQTLYLACGPDSPAPAIEDQRGRSPFRRTFAPKPCARCGRTFTPKGPRSLYCGCTAPAHPAHPEH